MNTRLATLILLSSVAFLATPSSADVFDTSTWMRTYVGGYGHDVLETEDGGALVAATFGAGFDCCRPWLIRLNADGSVRWQKTYEAEGLAGANNLVRTLDGGYLLSGEGTEFQVLKVDAEGEVLWAKRYGDGGYTHGRVIEADDGSILVTGATELGDGTASNGRATLLDPEGNVIWQYVFGRPYVPDFLTSATQAYNGNFIVAGSSRGDYWVMELDRATGAIVWQNVYGGPAEDTGLVVARVLRRHYVVVGASDSFTSGGLRNWWIAILQANGKLWREFSIGGFDAEDPHTAIATSDGGFLIGGGTGSFGAGFSDLWLVKFDSRAQVEWQNAYGRADRTDSAWRVRETASGYAVIGDSYLFPTDYEFWLMNLGLDGAAEQDRCGRVTATDAVQSRTNSSTSDAGMLIWPIDAKVVDLRVTANPQDVPIETCAP